MSEFVDRVAVQVEDYPDWQTASEAAVDEFLRGEHERQEREAVEETARLEAARSTSNVAVVSGGNPASVDPTCAGIPSWFPAHIAWRESRCTRGINTGNGYYGYAQVAGFHWFGGICDGLTWTDPASEDECVWRLSAGGSNFRPWGA